MSATSEEVVHQDETIYIRGVPFPAAIHFPPTHIEDAMDYMPRDGDIIIASYPKTGTTWMQYIVLQILSSGEEFPSFDEVMHHRVPFMEMTGVAAVDKLEGQRIYKHHLPYSMVQKNQKSKTIYTYRNPEDTVVSFYHFNQGFRTEPMDFDKFFDDWIAGKVGYGSYFDHALSYHAHRNDSNLLLVSYETLQKNRKTEILRIAQFLGPEYYDALQDEAVLDKIMERTSFDYMKSHLRVIIPKKMMKVEKGAENNLPEKVEINFFRKGIVGDGKTLLSPEQRRRIREAMLQKMGGTEIADAWLIE